VGFILEFAIIAAAAFLGWRVSRWINARTGLLPLGALVFALIFLLPWIDMIPGYYVLRQWTKSHPANVIYERHRVPGMLLAQSGESSAERYLAHDGAYRYVEIERFDSAGAITGYSRYFFTDSVSASCIRRPRPRGGTGRLDALCFAMEASEKPQSAFALEPLQPPANAEGSVFFLIRQHGQRVREIATGRVVAEAWRGIYVPWMARLGGFGSTIESPKARDFHPFRLQDVLIQQL
jgi:hypothetical protein